MTLKKYLALVMCCVTTGLAWGIEVGISVASVSSEGPYETVGSFTLTLLSNDLSNASPNSPIYIRFGLSQANGWARTLVDLRDDSEDDDAINLAVYGIGDTVLNPALPEDAVQLVRYVEGESYAWIRVNVSSSQWVLKDGSPSSPDPSNKVRISLGIRGSVSVRDNANTSSGGNEYDDSGDLADTRLIADYFQTPNFNNGDVDQLTLIAFDDTTSGVEDGSPAEGNNVGIGFSNDLVIARAANFIPCFEYHFEEGVFDSPAHEVGIGQVNRVKQDSYQASLPEVYLTNSSDFDWEPGSILYLVHPTYNAAYDAFGQNPPSFYDPELPHTYLDDAEVALTSDSQGTWQVEHVYWDNRFMGYKLTLMEGRYGVYEYVRLSGIRFFTDGDYEWHPLRLTAYGFYKAQGINPTPELEELVIPNRRTAELEKGTDGYVTYLPYTAHDRDDVAFSIQMANPHETTNRISMRIFHPAGLLKRIVGGKVLEPFEAYEIDFNELWPDEKDRQAWIALYSELPLVGGGTLLRDDGMAMDCFPFFDAPSKRLYGPHIPADEAAWETVAYMISANPEVDPDFFFHMPGATEQRVDGFIIPNGTGFLNDSDFNASGNRGSWFEVDAGDDTGLGLLFYNRRDNNGQMASVPMLDEPRSLWRYDHVGNPANGWWNGIVATNLEDSPQVITFEGYSLSGELLESMPITLLPQERKALLLSSVLSEKSEPYSRLLVQSDRPFLSFLLMGREEGDRLTTIPGNLPAVKDQMLHHIPNLNQYWVGLALINDTVGSVDVTLEPYLPEGKPGPNFKLTLDPLAKQLLNLSDYLSPEAGYSHLVVRASGNVRAYALTGDSGNRQLATLQLQPLPNP